MVIIVASSNLELFYDVITNTIEILYEARHSNYFTLLAETVNNILENRVVTEVDEETEGMLNRWYRKLQDKDFTPEDIRKALQTIFMRGFKEEKIANDLTPDTIGFLMSYIISKINGDNKSKLKILDPLVGTGNLIFSVSNQLENDTKLYGIDYSEFKIKICSMAANLMNADIELFMQDTTDIKLVDMDYVVCDLVNNSDTSYFPYEVILNHRDSLKENGYMICVIPNDFFEYDKDGEFKRNLIEKSSIYGIIELPDDFFISQQKSILIIKNAVRADKNVLMVKLPSFNDVYMFNNTLNKIEAWFEKNK